MTQQEQLLKKVIAMRQHEKEYETHRNSAARQRADRIKKDIDKLLTHILSRQIPLL